MKDKNGKEILIGNSVIMPDPKDDDLWSFGNFSATVISFKDESLITVTDCDDNWWDVEADRVELEESVKYAVDIPDPFNMEGIWINVGHFEDKEKALQFVKENFGADDEGRINLISEIKSE